MRLDVNESRCGRLPLLRSKVSRTPVVEETKNMLGDWREFSAVHYDPTFTNRQIPAEIVFRTVTERGLRLEVAPHVSVELRSAAARPTQARMRAEHQPCANVGTGIKTVEVAENSDREPLRRKPGDISRVASCGAAVQNLTETETIGDLTNPQSHSLLACRPSAWKELVHQSHPLGSLALHASLGSTSFNGRILQNHDTLFTLYQNGR